LISREATEEWLDVQRDVNRRMAWSREVATEWWQQKGDRDGCVVYL
jgi:hypothetical protein